MIMDRSAHNSPPIPADVFGREELPEQVFRLAFTTAKARFYDQAVRQDLGTIFPAYNAADAAAREAMDQAFVWFTGLTLASMAAIVEARYQDVEPGSHADIVDLWRKTAGQ